MTEQNVNPGQRVVLSACPGFDINNVDREFYGEYVVEFVMPQEVELQPRYPDRHTRPEDTAIFIRLPLPPAHQFQIEADYQPPVIDHPHAR